MDQTFAGVIIIMTNRSLLVCFVLQTQQQNSHFENLRLQITEKFAGTSTESLRKIIYLLISYHIKETSQRKITGIVKFLFDLS